MGKKGSVTLSGSVVQTNAAGAHVDEEGVKHVNDDVVVNFNGLEIQGADGAGRVAAGSITLTVPHGTFEAGETFEAELKVAKKGADDDEDEDYPSTLQQNKAEVEKGRKPDGSLGSGKSRGSSRRRTPADTSGDGEKPGNPSETEKKTQGTPPPQGASEGASSQ